MDSFVDIYCWTCNDFTLGIMMGQWGNKVFIRCQECDQYNTDEIVDGDTKKWIAEEREKVMASNDNAMLRRECRNKNCAKRNMIVATNKTNCITCGKPLDICRDQTKPVQGIDSDTQGQQSLAIVASGTPQSSSPEDRTVWARHHTNYEDSEKAWACWCGVVFPVAAESTKHDNTWSMMAWKDVPQGILIRELDNPPNEALKLPSAPAKPAQTDDWTCSADVTGCPLVLASDKTKVPQIWMPKEMFKKWGHLARSISTEWLAYLIGEEVAGDEAFPAGGWRITEMYFPKQRVTATHVTVDEEELRNLKPGVIGDVHSHVRMQAYFSHEDIKHMNHPVHIVVNARDEVDLSIRITLQCGKPSRIQGRLLLVGTAEEDAWEDELKNQFLPDPPAVETVASPSGPSANNAGFGANGSSDANQPTKTISGHRNSQETWRA